jgi:hypothetical protein
MPEKFLIEELHNLYFWPHVIRIIKSRSMRWEEHGREGEFIQGFDRET